MNTTFIYLSKYVGIFHKENNCLYEFLCETKDGYYEYILLTEY